MLRQNQAIFCMKLFFDFLENNNELDFSGKSELPCFAFNTKALA